MLHALDRRLEAITFPRSCVEFSDYRVAIGLPLTGEALALPEVLPNEPVEVRVTASLPRVMGIGKKSLHTGRLLYLPVAVELSAVVPGDRLKVQAASAYQLDRGAVHGTYRAMR